MKACGVLIVEDDADSLSLLQSGLQGHGLEVFTADSPEAARRAMEEPREPPLRVFITDLGLPEPEAGIGLIREIRARGQPALIVALSGQGSLWLDTARLAGADIVLSKPTDPGILVEVASFYAGQQ